MKGHALLHVFPAWARPQKRPSFSKNDGTTDHRSGPNTVSGERWDVRAFVSGPTPRLNRTPTSPRQIRPVMPSVCRRLKNDHRFRKTMGRPAIVPDKRPFVHGPFAVTVRRNPTRFSNRVAPARKRPPLPTRLPPVFPKFARAYTSPYSW